MQNFLTILPEILTVAGLIALLGFTPQSTNSKYAASSGTAYSLTATLAQILFGGASPAQPMITLDQPGRYLIFARVQMQFNGATFLANRTISLQLARMNNTPAVIGDAVTTISGLTTLLSGPLGGDMCMFGIYDTANSTDQVSIMGNVSTPPSLGSMVVNGSQIYAFRLADL